MEPFPRTLLLLLLLLLHFVARSCVVPRILRDTFVGTRAASPQHSFPGRSRPRGTREETGQEGGWNEGGRSHPREQQPADWPFYRADRSRLYEESHNGNLRSSLPSPQPHRPLTPRDLFSFASASLLLLSFFTSQHVLCVSS